MTREDALEIWLPIIKMGVKSMPECNEAIDMAIKALKQEPCTDAVNRKELLKIYEDRFLELQKIKHLKENKGAEDRQMGVNYCINILKEMPPVNPTEKVGRWEWNQYDGNPKIGNFHCSQCHGIGKAYYDYCPYCGSRMTQEVEE